MNKKSYSELTLLKTFKERLEYLKLHGSVGKDTFGYERYLNQVLYKSTEWHRIRNEVIMRDNGCDLGVPDRVIYGKAMVHHINPITPEDIAKRNPSIFDLDNLITVSMITHNAIHYGDDQLLGNEMVERVKNDTVPWRM